MSDQIVLILEIALSVVLGITTATIVLRLVGRLSRLRALKKVEEAYDAYLDLIERTDEPLPPPEVLARHSKAIQEARSKAGVAGKVDVLLYRRDGSVVTVELDPESEDSIRSFLREAGKTRSEQLAAT